MTGLFFFVGVVGLAVITFVDRRLKEIERRIDYIYEDRLRKNGIIGP